MSGNENESGRHPDGWVWASFIDVASIASSLVSPAHYGELPHVAPDNIERDTGRLLPYKTISEDAVVSPKHLFNPGQLLYSKIRPYLNKCVRVDFRGLCSADMYPLDARIDAIYLHYYMLSRQFVTAVGEASGSRTVLPKVNQDQLSNVPVPVAPLAEQCRIADALASYLTRLDDAVATLERVERNLERYRASVLKAAVEGRLVPTEAALTRQEGRDYEPASALLKRILAERRRRWAESGKKGKYQEPVQPDTASLPELPEGWCWATVESLSAKVVDGVHKKPNYTEHGVPFVTVRNLTAGPGISFERVRYVAREDHESFWSRANPEYGDILITKDGTLGVVRAIRTRQEFSIFVSVALVKPVERLMTDYLELVLSSPVVQMQMVPKGSGLQHIHLEDLRRDCIPLAPLVEQSRIVAAVQERLSIVALLERTAKESIGRVARLRQAILKWAFEGKLADQDPSDEPASVLLERIRAEREAAEPAKVRRAGRPVRAGETAEPAKVSEAAEPEKVKRAGRPAKASEASEASEAAESAKAGRARETGGDGRASKASRASGGGRTAGKKRGKA